LTGVERPLQAAGLDDPLEGGLGAGVGRLGEDLLGRPLLADDPWSRKQTRLDASRANDISWVASSMVIPSSASSRTMLRTSATNSGSRAEVISSRSSSLGRMARAPHDRHPLLLAPG